MILTNQVNVDPELKIGKYGVSYLLKRAAQILDAKSKGSELFDDDAENEFPRFNSSGEYMHICFYMYACCIYECICIHLIYTFFSSIMNESCHDYYYNVYCYCYCY